MKLLRSAALLVLVACGLMLQASGIAAASTTSTVVLYEKAAYACNGDCATATSFYVWGTAHAPGSGEGVIQESLQGQVLGYNQATNCLDQSEQWVFTARAGKDTLSMSTTSDSFCFTSDPNVNLESGTLVVTGATGRLAGATGTGTFSETVLTSPQVAWGTITLTLTV